MSVRERAVVDRRKVATEIYRSEEHYFQQLSNLLDVYYKPIEAELIIPEDKIRIIFSGVNDIRNLSQSFLLELKEALPLGIDFANAIIGPTFKTIYPYFKLYQIYAKNHPLAVQTLEEVLPTVQTLLTKQEFDTKSKMDLFSLLITPLQRITCYPMLLKRLLEATPEEHPDRKPLEEVLVKFQNTATEFERAVVEGEYYVELYRLQKRFQSEDILARTGRRLVMQGNLSVIRKENQVTQYTCFLLTDTMIFATGDSKFTKAFELRVSESFNIHGIGDIGKHEHMMEILSIDQSFDVSAPDDRSKETWIQQAASLPRPNLGENDFPIAKWIHNANACSICQTTFSLLNRRHHCRSCGGLVCNACSKHQRQVRKGGSAVRVCKRCNDRILGKDEQDGKDVGTDGDGGCLAVSSEDIVCEALLGFEGGGNDLELVVGDIVRVIVQHESGWWYGVNQRTGLSGWLDPGYVRRLR